MKSRKALFLWRNDHPKVASNTEIAYNNLCSKGIHYDSN